MEKEAQILDPEERLIALGKKHQVTLSWLRGAYEFGYITNWHHCIYAFAKKYFKERDGLIKKYDIDPLSVAPEAFNYFSIEILIEPELRDKEASKARLKIFQDKWNEDFSTIEPYLSKDDLRKYKTLPDERSSIVSYRQEDIENLASIVREPGFLDMMMEGNKTLKEAFLDNPRAAEILKDTPDFETLVESFSVAMSYTLANAKHGNPDIGDESKHRSDIFAEGMVDTINAVKAEGITTLRNIADRLNELDIPTARGGTWNHDSVGKLMRRIKKLGLDSEVKGESLDAG